MKASKPSTARGRGEQAVFAQWRRERLSIREKKILRQSLADRIGSESALTLPTEGQRGIWTLLFSRPALSFSLIIACLLSGSIGVAKASERALPGDSLYTVKIAINEPIEGLLHITPEARAEWERMRIERRLSEAEALVTLGRFGEEETKELDDLIDQHQTSLASYVGEQESEEERNIPADRFQNIELRRVKEDGKTRYRVHERGKDQKSEEDAHETEEEDSSIEAEDEKEEAREMVTNSVSDVERDENQDGKRQREFEEKKGRSVEKKKEETSKKREESRDGDTRESDQSSGSRSGDTGDDGDVEEDEDDESDEDDDNGDDDDEEENKGKSE